MEAIATKLSFSGHETFHCRSLWLKKGYDFVSSKNKFSNDRAIAELGVGKNMVSSIRFWLKAFGITDHADSLVDDAPASKLFLNDLDPYLEDIASLWLLHYSLVKTEKASLYNLVFNYFRKERIEFTKDQLYRFIKRHCEETNTPYNEKIVVKDVDVLLKNYLRPVQVSKNIEDEYSGLLIDLELIRAVRDEESSSSHKYSIESGDRPEIPWQVILFAILDFSKERIIAINDLMTKPNGVGLVFAMNAVGLIKSIHEIVKHNPNIHFTDDNGIKEIRFDVRPHKWKVLGEYYDKK